MIGFPININNVSGNGVVNVGGAFTISPLTASKTVFGSGGLNTGIVIENNFVSQAKMIDHQFSDQNVVKSF
ncbi:spore gernimation protein [Bacillus nakamurai]|jgi:spore germination protein PF|uniref:Spore gernimation protein n=1 Tax=Bacillus nakamurai TaxID=1793963 RepID=A0A150F6R5_9BACI|nr:spore germination protein [Bacillus nakamurai]KXZ18558.1 spore gernimation protein [Bacillus nakamurai]KXZ23020.1 spore gernimation protein [Bacillus nakamurai]MCC9023080.1 spore germination protein [Bacillus nakamurai]MCP6681107.1 spore germination protein [Bacillus nakamurai]MED1229405.1 spore germination protein [Bacillus nakamurai]